MGLLHEKEGEVVLEVCCLQGGGGGLGDWIFLGGC